MMAKLTPKQSALLAVAIRAKREPKMSWMFTERHVLGDADPRTIRALEQKGLVESYLSEGFFHTHTFYRLTERGEAIASESTPAGA